MNRKTIGTCLEVCIVLLCTSALHAQERKVSPTWLYRNTATSPEKPSDITSANCHYKPLFGAGDPDARALRSVARYGAALLDPQGACATVQYPEEDQILVVLDGQGDAQYGNDRVPLKKEDYLYVPATVSHALKNTSTSPMTVVIMGFRANEFDASTLPSHPLKANIEDIPTEFVSGHPESTHYRLLLGDDDGENDHFDVRREVTSFFLMQIDPGGTNFPHHHETAEEIYLILSGRGTIIAGGGMDGVEGRHPAKAGDAYFYRQNATVGYYSADGVESRLLCIRSYVPGFAPIDRAPKRPAHASQN